jgi:hypothetical protein
MATIQSITPSLYHGKKGEDATAHYYSFMDWLAELARTNPDGVALTDATKINMFKLTLRGEARNWIEDLAFASLANLKAAFKDRFGDEPTREQDIASIAINKLQAGEQVSQYSDRLTQSAARLAFPEELTRDWFQSGLPLQMQLYVKGSAPETLKDAVLKAKEYERLCKTKTETATSDVQLSLEELRLLVLQGKEESERPPYGWDSFKDGPYNSSRNGSREREYSRPNRPRSYERNNSQRSFSSERSSDYNRPRQNYNPPYRGRSRERTPEHGRRVNFDNSQNQRSGNRPYGNQPRGNYDRTRSPSRERGRSNERTFGRPNRYPNRSPQQEVTKTTNDNNTMTCWMCGKIGHLYKNCRHDRSMPFQSKMQMEGMKKFLSNIEHFSQNSG